MLLAAGTVGLSVTTFSIPILQSMADINKLKQGWYLLVLVIALGGLVLLGEGRLKYLSTWQGDSELSDWDMDDVKLRNKIKGWTVALLGLLHPVWFTRLKLFTIASEARELRASMLYALASLQHDVIFLEIIVYLLFVLALVRLVTSIG